MKRACAILGLVICGAGCDGTGTPLPSTPMMKKEDPPPTPTMKADDPPPPTPTPDLFVSIPARAETASGLGGAAATVDVRATLASIEILKEGGNAVDAAVTAASVLGVTDPFSCGIGGGGFMVIYLAAENRVVTIDHRETAPAHFDHKLFYDKDVVVPFNELVTSGLSTGVPGTVRGWDEALRRYGKLSFADVLKRAWWVAETGGFNVDKTFFDQTERNIDRFRAFSSTSKIYLTPESKSWPIDTIFKNPDLGKTYRLIAKNGAKAFYEGEIAKAIVETVQKPPLVAGTKLNVRPGVMELGDLLSYEARVRPAVETSYRGYTVYGMGLPSSGGLTIAMALNLLDGYETKGLSSADVLHRYIGATQLAYADRGAYMGDPEFVKVPVKGLLSAGYATERRALIDLQKAPLTAALPGNPYAHEIDPSNVSSPTPKTENYLPDNADLADALDRETTHITVTDKEGNIVSYTCTIEQEGGNGMVVEGYGFLLNNELTDFNMPADPTVQHPNVAEPGKRPRSSMSPTLVFKDGKGATIITSVLQTLVNHIDLGMPITAALSAPRISQRNSSSDGSTTAETAFLITPEATALIGLGHKLSDAGLIGGEIGAVTAIRWNPDGTVTAVAEPSRRNGGSAMVEQTK
jgi:gamma-glutamyltranspeptidase/glutathione hydrolase